VAVRNWKNRTFICCKCKLQVRELTDTEVEDISKELCTECKPAVRIDSCPSMILPGHMTYNGKSKCLDSVFDKKGVLGDKADVPINIIDPRPDGTCKVTRIGTKSQDPDD